MFFDPRRVTIILRLMRGDGTPWCRWKTICRFMDWKNSVRICTGCLKVPLGGDLDFCGPCRGAATIRFFPSVSLLAKCRPKKK